MIDNDYIFAEENTRIFINPSLGCTSKCSYCYLPNIGYKNDSTNHKSISSQKIIDQIEKNYTTINKETLITIGCYCECLDEHNKKETTDIIKYFLRKGNQVQLSTKRCILKEDFDEILPLIKYYGQLVVYISSATISNQKVYEKNTSDILERFNNFPLLKSLNIPAVLYMKPILKDVTIKDLELYKRYIKQYNIKDVVVGSMFTNKGTDEQVRFLTKNKLFYDKNDDEDIIASELSKYANVYRRSTEVIKKYKKV